MAKRSSSKHPQNRGLIAAVSIFAVAVLAGVWWITKQDEAGERPVILQAITPSFPQLRPQSSRADRGSEGGGTAKQERFARNHLARGAVVGQATVYRGDFIQVGSTPFRLVDINEIGGYAHCGPSSFNWPCGTTAQQALGLRVGDELVACYSQGYNLEGEQLGQCFVDSIDIGGWMVENGMAVPASDRSDYNIKRSTAKRERRGWWHTKQ
jgi:hypothetical protein